MSKLFSQNRSFSHSHLSTIEKPRKQKKNRTQSTNFFHTRNDSRLVTDSNKIISQVQTSSLAKKHHRQSPSFLQYSTTSVLHRAFSLLTVLVLINNIISLQWSFDTQLSSINKKINSTSLTYTQKLSLPRIRKTNIFVTVLLSWIILPPLPLPTLKTLHISISVFNTVTLVFSFSEESEAEKIQKNIQVNRQGLWLCRITHQSPLILNRSISIVRLRQVEANIDIIVPLSAPSPIVPVRLNAFTGLLFFRSRRSFYSTQHWPKNTFSCHD